MAPPKPGDAGREREHREPGADQVQPEGGARGLAVVHGEQAPAEAAPAHDDDEHGDRDERDVGEHAAAASGVSNA